MITTTDLTFSYPGKPPVLRGISLEITTGSHIALMGKNGTGKSTLALLLKGLLVPTSGTAVIDGFETSDDRTRREIVKRVGLVFQNPDNTMVATTVERELAFGLENMGVPQSEMRERVEEALHRFNLKRYCHTNPAHLSGGEKQCLALAAVMIMRPEHLILDEPTSLLDPWSRDSILDLIHRTAQEGMTVIHITQFIPEALTADRVLILDESGICADSPPDEVFTREKGYESGCIRFPAQSERRTDRVSGGYESPPAAETVGTHGEPHGSGIVTLERISHYYDAGTTFENRALADVSLALPSGSSTALLGPMGSGKTTLLEIAAGVTVPTQGDVLVGDGVVRAMAFQFPEDQMFGDTVESYMEFGPRNMGVDSEDLHAVVSNALADVGLNPVDYINRDPFTLSGGEKRRAALAGVLAMNPDVLILDEPVAGLDRDGMELIFRFLMGYVRSGGTLLFSTHDFEMAHLLAGDAVVLEEGRIEMYGRVNDVFGKSRWLSVPEKRHDDSSPGIHKK